MANKYSKIVILLLTVGAFTYFAFNLNKGESAKGLENRRIILNWKA